MRHIGNINIRRQVICGGLVLAAAAPAHAAPAPLPVHPVGATAATCEISARVAPRPYRTFSVEADRANCAGMLATRALHPETSARLTGRAIPTSACGWKIRDGRLALTVSTLTLEGPWATISVPFPTGDAAVAAALAGTSRAGHDRVGYSGLATLAPEGAKPRKPSLCTVAGGAIKVTIQLSLSTPVEVQES